MQHEQIKIKLTRANGSSDEAQMVLAAIEKMTHV